jgi:hypothetical protein
MEERNLLFANRSRTEAEDRRLRDLSYELAGDFDPKLRAARGNHSLAEWHALNEEADARLEQYL